MKEEENNSEGEIGKRRVDFPGPVSENGSLKALLSRKLIVKNQNFLGHVAQDEKAEVPFSRVC